MAKKTEADEKSAPEVVEIVEKAVAKPVDELTALKAELEATRTSRAGLEKQLKDATAALEELSSESASLRLNVKTLEEALLTQKPADLGGDCVMLNGVRYEILHRNKVKEFFEDIKRRHVPEDITAIAIDLKA